MNWQNSMYMLHPGVDSFPPPLLWATTQPGGVHLPLCHWYVRTPILHREPAGRATKELASSNALKMDEKKKVFKMTNSPFLLIFSRNWSFQKRPSLTFCPTSSTTVIRSSGWLPLRWGQQWSLFAFFVERYNAGDSHIKRISSVASSLGLRPQSLHRLWAQQRPASTTEGPHVHSRVPVHASHLAPQQVSRTENARNPRVTMHHLSRCNTAPSCPSF